MNRAEKIRSIRPVLELDTNKTLPIEKFQNETLRPILKLQHELTQFLLIHHKNYDISHHTKADEQEYRKYLKQFLQTNVDFKNQILGAIIGQFVQEELEFYSTQKKEMNKRIIQMQLNRYVDALKALQ